MKYIELIVFNWRKKELVHLAQYIYLWPEATSYKTPMKAFLGHKIVQFIAVNYYKMSKVS